MKTDVYQKITDQIMGELEKGVRPWLKPWNAEHVLAKTARRMGRPSCSQKIFPPGSRSFAHQGYPFSYALNVLGEVGQLSLLFKPRERYDGMSPAEWVIARLSDGGRAEGNRLFMLGNALVNQALRLRYVRARETPTFEKFNSKLP